MYQTDQEKDNQVKVWDLSLRVFHFILIILIIGSYISAKLDMLNICLLYTSPSPRDVEESRMPSSA